MSLLKRKRLRSLKIKGRKSVVGSSCCQHGRRKSGAGIDGPCDNFLKYHNKKSVGIAYLFPALDHCQRRRPVQLALIQRRTLGVATLGLMLRDDLGRDVNQVLLLVVLDQVQALQGRK
jgi:hypothetical protein